MATQQQSQHKTLWQAIEYSQHSPPVVVKRIARRGLSTILTKISPYKSIADYPHIDSGATPWWADKTSAHKKNFLVSPSFLISLSGDPITQWDNRHQPCITYNQHARKFVIVDWIGSSLRGLYTQQTSLYLFNTWI